jgi:hypothetical protein
LQIDLINSEISVAKKGNVHGKPLIDDPMESIVEAHVSMLEWHSQSRKFGMTAVQLELLQQKSIEVLESFKSTFPEKKVLPIAGNSKRPIAFCGAMEGPFLVKYLWIKLWNCAKRGCRTRNPGLVALRPFGAGVMPPGQRELPLRSE